MLRLGGQELVRLDRGGGVLVLLYFAGGGGGGYFCWGGKKSGKNLVKSKIP